MSKSGWQISIIECQYAIFWIWLIAAINNQTRWHLQNLMAEPKSSHKQSDYSMQKNNGHEWSWRVGTIELQKSQTFFRGQNSTSYTWSNQLTCHELNGPPKFKTEFTHPWSGNWPWPWVQQNYGRCINWNRHVYWSGYEPKAIQTQNKFWQFSKSLKKRKKGKKIKTQYGHVWGWDVCLSLIKSIDRSINRSNNQSINQSTNRSVNQSTNLSTNQSTNPPINQLTNQSTNRWINQSHSRSGT